MLFKDLKIIVKTSFPSNSKEVGKRIKYKQTGQEWNTRKVVNPNTPKARVSGD